MTITLLASQCPSPQYRTAFLSVAAAASQANAPVSDPITTGSPLGFVGKLNANSMRQDLTGSFGGGAYFAAQGLTLAPGPELTVAVASGVAMIDGPVCLEAAHNLPVPASSGPVFVWLLQSGLLAYTLGLAPPPTPACLLGSCTTSADAVTAVDTSGVLMGLGILQRKTADAGIPADAPPAALHFITVTKGGTYYWNGAAYIDVASPPSSVVVFLAASVQSFASAGANYLVTADFSGAGLFSDTFFDGLLTTSNASFTISANENGRTTGKMSWIVYVPSSQSSALANISLAASLRGRGWTGAAAANIAANWSVAPIQ